LLYFVFLVILAVVAIVGLIAIVVDKSEGGSGVGGMATVAGSIALLVIVTLIFSATTVGARSVGVQTAFGQYKGTLSSGFHWTAPWANVEEFSTRIQPLDLDGNDSIGVNFQGGGQGSVETTVRWYIDTDNAEKLWQKYKSFDNVRDQLVKSAAKDSFRVIIGKYSPNDARSGENLRPITNLVKDDLDKTLAAYGVKVDSISVKGIALDSATQKSLEKVVVANNDIERAKSEQERAVIDAKTAEIREKAGVLSGPALVRYCLEVTNAWDTSKNGPLPAGWNCFAPSTLIASK
jgi:regulator of protease activity HflC (stomatin/prohibitin superfamily)